MRRETASEIDVSAADWVVRMDRGLSDAESRDLDRWLEGDSRRLGAFARLRAVSAATERAAALGPGYAPADFAAPARPTRRGLLMRGGLAAGIAGLGVLGLWQAQGRRFATQRGELRVVPLEDGSVVTLNTDSRLLVRYSETQRSLRLLKGEALFEVAKDVARPFVVEADGVQVRAVGTSFTVSRLPDRPVQVLVREGIVDVGRPATAAPSVRVAANHRVLAVAAAVEPHAVNAAEISRELAWRDGRIAFEGETLAEAARSFERYSDIRIRLDDPAIARETITGLFQANDPVGFSQAVAAAFGWRADVDAHEVRITSAK